jgi:hypothetical protein
MVVMAGEEEEKYTKNNGLPKFAPLVARTKLGPNYQK